MIGRRRIFSVISRNYGVILVSSLLCLTFITLPATAQIKCWTNHEGVRECGNVVPPEFAQKGHEEISPGGITIKSEGRAKSMKELQAERAAARAAAEQAARDKAQAAKDKVLLDTFSSEHDLLLARDGQLSHLDSQVKITESHIGKLQKSLEELIQEAADIERRGKQPPENLIAEIDSLRAQINDNATSIVSAEQERREIIKRFDADIERFKALKKN